MAAHRSDFAAGVEELLGGTESIIQVHHTTQIEATALKQLLHVMARKIQLQELELLKQNDIIAQLQEEMQLMRSRDDEQAVIRKDLRKVQADIETLSIQQKVQGQRVDRLGSATEDLQMDVSRVVYIAQGRRSHLQRKAVAAALWGHRGPSSM